MVYLCQDGHALSRMDRFSPGSLVIYIQLCHLRPPPKRIKVDNSHHLLGCRFTILVSWVSPTAHSNLAFQSVDKYWEPTWAKFYAICWISITVWIPLSGELSTVWSVPSARRTLESREEQHTRGLTSLCRYHRSWRAKQQTMTTTGRPWWATPENYQGTYDLEMVCHLHSPCQNWVPRSTVLRSGRTFMRCGSLHKGMKATGFVLVGASKSLLWLHSLNCWLPKLGFS